jgi:hypothetical protein
MCWYSVEDDEADEKLVSNDDKAMDNDLVSVVKRIKYQFRSVQTTFAVLLARWKERTGRHHLLASLNPRQPNTRWRCVQCPQQRMIIRLPTLSRQFISIEYRIGAGAAKL